MTTKHTPNQKQNKTAFAFAGFDDWVEIFQAGEQTDSQGNANQFTTADLDSMVSNHQPSPLVVGHPKTDDPAWGWSAALKREGNSLFGQYTDVQPAFAKMVEDKQFPERSIKIKATDNGYQLVHTGFLGAMAPAIPGMSRMQFNQEDEQCLEFSGDWYVTSRLSRLFRRMKNYLIEDKGEAKAEAILPEYELDSLSESATEQRISETQLTNESVPGSFNKDPEGEMTVDKFTQQQLDDAVAKATTAAAAQAKSDAATEYAAKLAGLELKQRHSDASQRVDSLLTEQKLLPAQAYGLAEFMASLNNSDEATFEFSVGEGAAAKTETQSPAQFFNAFLDSLPEHGLLNKLSNDDTQPDNEFSAHEDANYDPDELAIRHKAFEYMDAHAGVDFISAVKAVGG